MKKVEININRSILEDINNFDHTLYFCIIEGIHYNSKKIELVSYKKNYKDFDLINVVKYGHDALSYFTFTKNQGENFLYFKCSINKDHIPTILDIEKSENIVFYWDIDGIIYNKLASLYKTYDLDNNESYNIYEDGTYLGYNTREVKTTDDLLGYNKDKTIIEKVIDLLILRGKQENIEYTRFVISNIETETKIFICGYYAGGVKEYAVLK